MTNSNLPDDRATASATGKFSTSLSWISTWQNLIKLFASADVPAESTRVRLEALEERVLYDASPLMALASDFGSVQHEHQIDIQLDELSQLCFEAACDYPLMVHKDFGIETDSIEHDFPLVASFDEPQLDDYQLNRQLVVIDERIEGCEDLVADITLRGNKQIAYDVLTLDANTNGIEQISGYLELGQTYEAIHLVGHGSENQLQLGTAELTSQTLHQYQEQISGWADGLNADADILIYGCEVAASEQGRLLVDQISEFTGADVAASDDLTGNADLGGDWDFEYIAGTVETSQLFSLDAQTHWQGLLNIYTVTNTLDDGSVGSLRWAISQTNANAGFDTINFNIAGAGVHVINISSSLPTITDAVTINGLSEPDYAGTPVVRIDGAAAGFSGFSVTAGGADSTIQGLMITGFTVDAINIASGANNVTIADNWIGTSGTGTTGIGNSGVGNTDDGIDIAGSNASILRNVITNSGDEGIAIVGSGVTGHVVQGNIIGLDPDGATGSGNTDVGLAIISGSGNTIGGTTAATRNVISNNYEGIEINTSNNIVQGNYIGTDATGSLDRGNHSSDGVEILGSATGNLIGGTTSSAGNLISGNFLAGIQLNGTGSNIVQGNYIGTNAPGTGIIANDQQGVYIGSTSSGNLIGGTTSGAGNLISGNNASNTAASAGIYVLSSGNTIQGNLIGTDITGTANLANNGAGISLDTSAEKNLIGGTGSTAGNIIAFNNGDGIRLFTAAGSGNALLRNQIFSNAGDGIDLKNNGITANDAGDVDTGPNDLQNFAVLTSAGTDGSGKVAVAGSLNTTANSTARIEFFVTDLAAAGNGEGKTYLGYTTAITDSNGNSSFVTSFDTTLAAGQFITSTTTVMNMGGTYGSTSEFSANVQATDALIVDTTTDVVDGTTTNVAALLAGKGADGFISLREAIIATNNTGGTETIILPAGTFTMTIGGFGEDLAATGDLDISDNLTIAGAGTGLTIIDGGALDRVFQVLSGTVGISDLTIQNGLLTSGATHGAGIAIAVGAGLTLDTTDVVGNQANGASSYAGGIYNAGIITIVDSSISNNSATSGGGLYNIGTAALSNSLISANAGNIGGGIYHTGASTLDLTNVTISGNTSNGNGGGIYSESTVTATNITVTDNESTSFSGGGVRHSSGTFSVTNSIIAGNRASTTFVDFYGTATSPSYNIVGDTTGALGFGGTDILDVAPTLGVLADNGGPTLTHALLAGSRGIDEGNNTAAPAIDQRGVSRGAYVDIGAYEVPGVTADALWLSTKDDVVSSGAPGLSAWTDGELLEFGGPNLAFEPTGTDGTFSSALNFNSFFDGGNVDLGSQHYVTKDITVGSGANTFDLFAGDVLFSFEGDQTIGATTYFDNDLHVFHPGTPGNYGSGTISVLLEGLADFKIRAITLVEQDTWVGDVLLQAGEFLYFDNNYAAEIRHFDATGVGVGTTAGTKQTFLNSSGAYNVTQDMVGLELIEVETTIGGETLAAGMILVSAAEPDVVGNNSLAVDDSDIYALTVSQTIMGSATSSATAAMFMDGSVVGLADSGEDIVSLTLHATVTGNSAPTITSNGGGPTAAVSISENTNTVTTVTSTDPDGPTTTYSINGGTDATKFAINSSSGELTFVAAPDYENPTDSGADNIYDVIVEVSDGTLIDTQSIAVTVLNVAISDVTVSGSATASAGGSFTLTLSANEDATGWTVNWGDGTTTTEAGIATLATHVYSNVGMTYSILVSATDASGTFTDSNLLTGSYSNNSIYLLDGNTGFVQQTLAAGSVGGASGVTVGPNGDFFAISTGTDSVLRYDGTTGALVGTFVTAGSGGLDSPYGLAFGPDGNLYVTNYDTDQVLRYDGTTGAFIDAFVTAGSGGLDGTNFIEFGPDGNLYVSGWFSGKVHRYDGTTGAYIDDVADTEGFGTTGFAFGPDGNLYVGRANVAQVLIFDGTTGTKVGQFAPAGGPYDLEFGSDGFLYVSYWSGDQIDRYDISTLTSAGIFATNATSSIDGPWGMVFTPDHQVTITNVAPVLDNTGTMTLTTITEGETTNSGDTVASIISSAGGDRITDVDSGAVEGIAIFDLVSSNGTWQYDTGSGWTDVGTVSIASSLLLRDTDSLRFVPGGQSADTGFVTFAAWDQTSGIAGTKVDTSVYGGTTAFSDQVETAAISVSAVNDAPTFSIGTGSTITDIGTSTDGAMDLIEQPDGKYLVAGYGAVSGNFDFTLVRYNEDGTIDSAFGTGGVVTAALTPSGSDVGQSVALQSDGKILVAGYDGNYDFALVRYNSDGSLDSSFGTGGIVATSIGSFDFGRSVVVQSDGRIVVAGTTDAAADRDFAVVRYNTDGSLDAGFGSGGIAIVDFGFGDDQGYDVAIQTDGKLLVTGSGNNGIDDDFALMRFNTNGSLDTSFGSGGIVTTDFGGTIDLAYSSVLQPDGKIVVAGWSNDGQYDFALARYNADGSLDASFGSGGTVTTSIGIGDDRGFDVTLQADGKILVTGRSDVGSSYDFATVRYNSDGSLDASFGSGGILTSDLNGLADYGYAVLQKSDGTILVAGHTYAGVTSDFGLVRYNADGSLFEGFNPVNTLDGAPTFIEGGAPVVLDADVQIFDQELSPSDDFSGATLTLARNGGANVEDAYSATGNLSALTQGGNLVLSGVTVGTVTTNSGGMLILTFNSNATQARVDEVMQSIAYSNNSDTPPATAQIDWLFSDGNSGAQGSGGALTANGSTTVSITAVNDPPSVNTTPSTLGYVENDGAVAVDSGLTLSDPDSGTFVSATVRIIVGFTSGEDQLNFTDQLGITGSYDSGTGILTLSGTASVADYETALRLVAYENTSESPSTTSRNISFTVNDGASSSSSGRLVSVTAVNDGPSFTDGSAAPGDDGIVTTDIATRANNVFGMTVQPDGKVLVAGQSGTGAANDFALLRYHPNGSLDTSFGTGGAIITDIAGDADIGFDVAVQPDGKILISGQTFNGTDYDFAVLRYNSDGSPDVSFGTGGIVTTDFGGLADVGKGIALQADGKILMTGFTFNGADYDFAVVRYNSDGSLDGSFGTGGLVTTGIGPGDDEAVDVAVQPDGKILVSGQSFNGANDDFALVRYNADGSLDTSFGAGGKVTTDFALNVDKPVRFTLQTDGKILLAGSSHNGTDYDFALARYNSDGSLDAGFGSGGLVTTSVGAGNDLAYNVAVQADGKIVVSGDRNNGSDDDFAAVRYNSDGTLDASFGSGGKVTTPVGAGTDKARAFALQSDGKFLLAGFSNNGTDNDIAVVRYNTDGSLDTTFDATNTLDGNPTFVEGGAAVILDSDINVFDAELSAADNYDGASLTIFRNGGSNSDDVFSFAGNLVFSAGNLVLSGITVGTVDLNSGGTLQLTFNTNATQAHINETLQSIAYSNSSDAPPVSVQLDWTFDDGNAGTQGSGGALDTVGSTVVQIDAVNDAPVNYASGPKTVIEETASAISGLAIDDVDAGASLITTRLVVSNGILNVSLAGSASISVGSNDSSDLTIEGTVADINATLASLSYTGDTDVVGIAADSMTIITNDGGNTGSGGPNTTVNFLQIDITPANDAPQATNLNAAESYTEETPLNLTDIVVSDVDDTDVTVTLTLSQFGAGSFSTATSGAVTSTFASGVWTASGLIADVNSLLANVTFTPTGDYANDFTITTSVDDGEAAPVTGVKNIIATPVNDAPVLFSGSINNLVVLEDSGLTSLGVGGVTFRSGGGADEWSQTLTYEVTVVPSRVFGDIYLADGLTKVTTTTYTLAELQGMQFRPADDATGGPSFFQFRISDDGGTANGGSDYISPAIQLNITPQNDAPDLTLAGTALNYTENDGPVAIDGTLAVTDVDDTDLTGATVRILAGFDSGEDSLAFVDQLGITGVYNSGTGILSLSGTASVADYQSALRSVIYENSSDDPSNATRTVSFTVNDGDNDSIIQTRDITVAQINDDPTNSGSLPTDIVVIEETASNVDLSSLNLNDFDAGSSSLTVTLSTSAGGVLTATTGGGVTVVGSGSDTITLTGYLTDLNTFIDTANNVQYTGPTNLTGNDADTIQVDVTDNGNTGAGGGGTLSLGTVNVDITNVNDVPVEGSIEIVPLAYTENDLPTAITSTLTISDVDDTNIESATIQITGNYANGQDILAFTNTGTITGVWNAVSGTMTLTGSDTLANYEAALRSVTYENSSDDPSNATRTVSFTVNDGDNDSNIQTRDITVAQINDDPTNAGSLPTDIVVIEETASNVDLSSLNLNDFDAGTSSLTVTLSTSAGGILTASTGGGVAIVGSGTGTITLTGNLTDLNTFIDTASNVQYTGPTNLTGNDADAIQVEVTDNGNTGAGGGGTIALGTVNVDITNVNDAPIEGTIEVAPLSYTENDVPTVITSTLTISDIDDTNLESATIQITGNYAIGEDVLAFTNTGTITGVWDGVTGSLTLTGSDTLANYEAALRSVTYENTSDDPGNATRTVGFSVNDGDNDSNIQTRGITVSPINDAPIATAIEAAPLAYTENDLPTSITNSISINDVDDTLIESATIQITGNYASGQDVLEFANTGTITGVWDAISGTLTLVGSDTLANYESALQSVTYENTSDDPAGLTRTVTFITNDGDDDSNIQTRDIEVSQINDDPTSTGSLPTDILAVEEISSNVDLSPLNLSDLDAGAGDLTVTLQTSAGGILTAGSSGGVTVAGSGSATITLTGNFADLNTYLDSATNVQYTGPINLTGNDADTILVEVSDNGNTGAGGGGIIGMGIVNVDIANVNDAPVASPDAVTVAEGATINVAPSGVLDNDTDIEGDPLTAALVSGPANGSLVLNPDGSFSYTHDGSETTVDSFVYQVADGNGGFDTQTVTITVTPVNDAPVANAESYSTAEDTALISPFDVLFNDTDAEGDSLAISLLAPPVHADSFVLDPSGSFNYVPESNFYGVDTFSYRIDDGNGGVDSATVTITVTPINDTPEGSPDEYSTAVENTISAIVSVLNNDADVEGDPLTAILLSGPANGTLSLAADGTFVYTPNAGFIGVDSFTYVPNDGMADGVATLVNIDVVIGTIIDNDIDKTPEPPEDEEKNIDPNPKTEPDEIDKAIVADVPPNEALIEGAVLKLGTISDFDGETQSIFQLLADRRQAENVLKIMLHNVDADLLEGEESKRRLDTRFGTAFDPKYLWHDLDSLNDLQRKLFGGMNVSIGAITAVSTIGYIFWSLRGGVLIAAALSQMPNWRLIDPLPVLESYETKSASSKSDDMQGFFDNHQID